MSSNSTSVIPPRCPSSAYSHAAHGRQEIRDSLEIITLVRSPQARHLMLTVTIDCLPDRGRGRVDFLADKQIWRFRACMMRWAQVSETHDERCPLDGVWSRAPSMRRGALLE